jgi:hypothetical protein
MGHVPSPEIGVNLVQGEVFLRLFEINVQTPDLGEFGNRVESSAQTRTVLLVLVFTNSLHAAMSHCEFASSPIRLYFKPISHFRNCLSFS